MSHDRFGVIERYRERLPLPAGCRIISLGEGGTPLIELENLPRRAGARARIFVKFEGLNPTGSFKDRGMTVAVTRAVADGARAVICASTGNTSASAAAYAARAGIKSFVVIPDGKIAAGKLAQAVVEGAVVLQVAGNFDEGLRLVRQVAAEAPLVVVNSVNPYRLQGQKTAAFEIVEALGRAPDYHCIPVGNAGNITAHWIGYSEYAGINTAANTFKETGFDFAALPAKSGSRPVMLGYQASGAAPFLRGAMVDAPETIATAIRIGHPQSWDQAWTASRESGGWFGEFTDAEILETQRLLAAEEGIFCEPASAISVAGALREIITGKIPAGSTIVCTLTGHGLKDVDAAMRHAGLATIKVVAKLEEVRRAILDHMD
jgi:threonine synthase